MDPEEAKFDHRRFIRGTKQLLVICAMHSHASGLFVYVLCAKSWVFNIFVLLVWYIIGCMKQTKIKYVTISFTIDQMDV